MKIFSIEAGTFKVDGGAAFGVVPKVVWQKRYPCDEDNYCTISMRCLLVDTGSRLVLFDAGTGDKQLEYLRFYGFKDVINFEEKLAGLGYSCGDVTDVVFTHLHFDHCGGATRFNADKTSVELVFPNAIHWVGALQWDNFLNPNVREGDSYFSENMMAIHDAGKLQLLNENRFLCPEIELRLFSGHTHGQIVGYVHLGKRTLMYLGDVIPLMANVPLAWISSYDILPVEAMDAKKIILDEAAANGYVLFFEHDTYTECCTVVANYKKHKVKQVLTLAEVLQSI